MTDAFELEEGRGAPPRANGELVFTEPWQSRLFATTMTLRERDLIDWERFRQGLISEIASHEAELDESGDYDYWGCWQKALEGLLAELDLVSSDRLAGASRSIAERPPDH